MPSADSGPFETRHLRDQLRRLRRAEEILKKDVTRARQERAFDELKIFKKDLKSVMEAAESIERAIAKFNSRKRI
jgi:N-glycosylase/DNA lyase